MGHPKGICSASLQPKNITYCYALTPVNGHKNPETMSIEARIASTEPRNITLIMFYAQKFHGHDFSNFGPKNVTSGNNQTRKYWT